MSFLWNNLGYIIDLKSTSVTSQQIENLLFVYQVLLKKKRGGGVMGCTSSAGKVQEVAIMIACMRSNLEKYRTQCIKKMNQKMVQHINIVSY